MAVPVYEVRRAPDLKRIPLYETPQSALQKWLQDLADLGLVLVTIDPTTGFYIFKETPYHD